jgi:hypothetical protein
VTDFCGSPLAERDAEKFAKKLLGEREVEAVLQRLDRLTQEEARVTRRTRWKLSTRFDNLKVVMDGAYETLLGLLGAIDLVFIFGIDGKASTDGIRQALGYVQALYDCLFLQLT